MENEQEARGVQRTQMTCSLNRAKGVVLITGLVAGLGMSVGGCNGPLKRMGGMNNRSNEPVNTGLSAIPDAPELKLPENESLISRDDDHFGSVRAQIEESARQLNVYFANLEIDGVGDGPVTQVEGTGRVELTKDVSKKDVLMVPVEEGARVSLFEDSASVSPDVDRDSGVRVSLLGGEGGGGDGGGASSGDQSSRVPSDDEVEGGDKAEGTSTRAEDVRRVEVEPMVRKEELARELASILGRLASTSDDPGSAALALASLETLLPDGFVDSMMDQGMLSDAERTSLDAARAFLRSLSSGGTIASPSEVASELEEIQAQLDQWAGLTIKKAVLCTRVDGYGWYETFPSYRFMAGKAQPVIVYVELERFAQGETTGPDGQPRYQTKFSQRLELYHVADDLNTWNRQAETVTGETRNRLRDYYLTNQVTLPANLGVGRYHLKVVMRDFIGERMAEAIIPIEIVAR